MFHKICDLVFVEFLKMNFICSMGSWFPCLTFTSQVFDLAASSFQVCIWVLPEVESTRRQVTVWSIEMSSSSGWECCWTWIWDGQISVWCYCYFSLKTNISLFYLILISSCFCCGVNAWIAYYWILDGNSKKNYHDPEFLFFFFLWFNHCWHDVYTCWYSLLLEFALVSRVYLFTFVDIESRNDWNFSVNMLVWLFSCDIVGELSDELRFKMQLWRK